MQTAFIAVGAVISVEAGVVNRVVVIELVTAVVSCCVLSVLELVSEFSDGMRVVVCVCVVIEVCSATCVAFEKVNKVLVVEVREVGVDCVGGVAALERTMVVGAAVVSEAVDVSVD